MHDHLRRLDRVWVEHPIYFVTTVAYSRRPILATADTHAIFREVWVNCEQLYGWRVGRYVIMPDHLHFFCAPQHEAKPLSTFVGKWKEWTGKYAARRLQVPVPLWQPEFFDHALRSAESYDEKWNYVRMNPERAGLVSEPDEWQHQGEIHGLLFD
jgi:REP element-mobilizing transposase RayT